jgi:hypothetical protein
MARLVYRYTLGESVPAEEVEVTLLLAIIATESLHGEVGSRLDMSHAFDADRRVVAIDAATDAGRDLNKLFVGFLTKEYGPAAFRVERVEQPASQPEPMTA